MNSMGDIFVGVLNTLLRDLFVCEVAEDAIRVVDFLTKFGCGFIGLSEPFLELRHGNASRVGLVCRVLVDYVEGLAETTEIATTRTVPIESSLTRPLSLR